MCTLFLLNYTYNLYIYKSTGGINGHENLESSIWKAKEYHKFTESIRNEEPARHDEIDKKEQ
jgi:hypothetical protein